ncbi:MAG: lipoyl domain-containing protein, partial [Nonlabens sp.]|nr:lipoyl domain-containing protein [Nonlabens sp.]
MDFILPKMGESITEGTILNWIVKEGQSFEEGDVLVEVGTDKVDNEVPALTAGIMKTHMCAAGDVVEIGSVLAQYEETDGSSTTTLNAQMPPSQETKDVKQESKQSGVKTSSPSKKTATKQVKSTAFSVQ